MINEKEILEIKGAIKHIDEVLESNCNKECKRDHMNLKRWLQKLVNINDRSCKKCIHFNGVHCEVISIIDKKYPINYNEFWCNQFKEA